MASKPSIPKGTRDFSPAEVAKRQYIISIIKSNFEKFGFQPIETPSFENSETLMGKYGEEGDRLIFKILNSGDFLKDVEIYQKNSKEVLRKCLEDAFIILFKKKFENQSNVDLDQLKSDEFQQIFNIALYKNDLFELSFGGDTIGGPVSGQHLASINIVQKIQSKYLNKTILEPEKLIQNAKDFGRLLERTVFKYEFEENQSKKIVSKISEKALRYDLTVPFARYVVQHQNEIEFPFKRYQIQPVWRADRPQKGRFREFYQCDADVVGSKSLWQEVELVQLYDAVFTALGLKGVTIKINNRKILSGIAEVIGASDKLIDFTVALDKLDKIGEEGVKKEMIEKGISENAIEKVQPLFDFTGSISEKIKQLSGLLISSAEGMKGVSELQFICDTVTKLGLRESILDLDVTLARGLNYYTGAIFEVAPPEGVAMGSIGGGGRYDDLTGIFGLKDMSGVGISFGLDRIYLVLEELNLFPETILATSKALFINYGEKEAFYAMQAITKLRAANIKVELYPDAIKVGKQFMHADKRQIPYAIIVGETEMNEEKFALKNLISGEQILVDFDELKNQLASS